jgi:hypothetical protein
VRERECVRGRTKGPELNSFVRRGSCQLACVVFLYLSCHINNAASLLSRSLLVVVSCAMDVASACSPADTFSALNVRTGGRTSEVLGANGVFLRPQGKFQS